MTCTCKANILHIHRSNLRMTKVNVKIIRCRLKSEKCAPTFIIKLCCRFSVYSYKLQFFLATDLSSYLGKAYQCLVYVLNLELHHLGKHMPVFWYTCQTFFIIQSFTCGLLCHISHPIYIYQVSNQYQIRLTQPFFSISFFGI